MRPGSGDTRRVERRIGLSRTRKQNQKNDRGDSVRVRVRAWGGGATGTSGLLSCGG